MERNVFKVAAISGVQPHLNLYKGKNNPFFLPVNIYLKWMGLAYVYKGENGGFSGRIAEPELKELSLILIPVMGPRDK